MTWEGSRTASISLWTFSADKWKYFHFPLCTPPSFWMRMSCLREINYVAMKCFGVWFDCCVGLSWSRKCISLNHRMMSHLRHLLGDEDSTILCFKNGLKFEMIGIISTVYKYVSEWVSFKNFSTSTVKKRLGCIWNVFNLLFCLANPF